MFEVCEEMQKLRDWLDEREIKWKDNSTKEPEIIWMCRTHFTVDDRMFSVINGVGSYGGSNIGCGLNHGKLECWIDEKGEPEGWLTAEDVIAKILGE